MKLSDFVKCFLFFAIGFLTGATDDLLSLVRSGQTHIVWATLFEPVTFLCALKGGVAVLMAYIIQSPLARQVVEHSVPNSDDPADNNAKDTTESDNKPKMQEFVGE